MKKGELKKSRGRVWSGPKQRHKAAVDRGGATRVTVN